MSVIEIHNLVKHFGSTRAVDGVSLRVESGEVFGFLGPNGAGKTTTIRCMMDFIRPSDGAIRLLGKDAQQQSVEIKKEIGYLSGNVHLYDAWTGREHIQFVKKLQGADDDISDALIERFDFDPTKKTKELSSGNRQKLGIILALMTKPKLILLDEPTNALDPLLQNEVYKVLQGASNDGATIFMSSHNLSEVDRICSRVGIIKNGTMVATESIQALKEKRLYTVRVHMHTQDRVPDFSGEDVEVVRTLDHTVLLKVKGDVNSFIQKLASVQVKDVEIEHASLEDIFLEYYQ